MPAAECIADTRRHCVAGSFKLLAWRPQRSLPPRIRPGWRAGFVPVILIRPYPFPIRHFVDLGASGVGGRLRHCLEKGRFVGSTARITHGKPSWTNDLIQEFYR